MHLEYFLECLLSYIIQRKYYFALTNDYMRTNDMLGIEVDVLQVSR